MSKMRMKFAFTLAFSIFLCRGHFHLARFFWIYWRPFAVYAHRVNWLLCVFYRCSLLHIDFEGRSDGESIKRILSLVNPRNLVSQFRLQNCSNWTNWTHDKFSDTAPLINRPSPSFVTDSSARNRRGHRTFSWVLQREQQHSGQSDFYSTMWRNCGLHWRKIHLPGKVGPLFTDTRLIRKPHYYGQLFSQFLKMCVIIFPAGQVAWRSC